MSNLAFLVCVATTLPMTGLIWFVQVVHYPLFARVEPGTFRAYHADHVRLTTRVVVAPMILELAGSGWLALSPPRWAAPAWAWAGLAMAVVAWASTAFWSVPAHGRLAAGFVADAHRALVVTNAARVVAWTAHALILLAMLASALAGVG